MYVYSTYELFFIHVTDCLFFFCQITNDSTFLWKKVFECEIFILCFKLVQQLSDSDNAMFLLRIKVITSLVEIVQVSIGNDRRVNVLLTSVPWGNIATFVIEAFKKQDHESTENDRLGCIRWYA